MVQLCCLAFFSRCLAASPLHSLPLSLLHVYWIQTFVKTAEHNCDQPLTTSDVSWSPFPGDGLSPPPAAAARVGPGEEVSTFSTSSMAFAARSRATCFSKVSPCVCGVQRP